VVQSNLRGPASPTAFWRRFPAIHIVQYQCSPLSSAQAIQHQYDMAVSYHEHGKEGKTLTLLLLDEVVCSQQSCCALCGSTIENAPSLTSPRLCII